MKRAIVATLTAALLATATPPWPDDRTMPESNAGAILDSLTWPPAARR